MKRVLIIVVVVLFNTFMYGGILKITAYYYQDINGETQKVLYEGEYTYIIYFDHDLKTVRIKHTRPKTFSITLKMVGFESKQINNGNELNWIVEDDLILGFRLITSDIEIPVLYMIRNNGTYRKFTDLNIETL